MTSKIKAIYYVSKEQAKIEGKTRALYIKPNTGVQGKMERLRFFTKKAGDVDIAVKCEILNGVKL